VHVEDDRHAAVVGPGDDGIDAAELARIERAVELGLNSLLEEGQADYDKPMTLVVVKGFTAGIDVVFTVLSGGFVFAELRSCEIDADPADGRRLLTVDKSGSEEQPENGDPRAHFFAAAAASALRYSSRISLGM